MLQREGCEVAIDIRDEAVAAGDGLVNRARDSKFVADSSTLIIADCTNFGVDLDLMRWSGFKVVGGSALADKLERDRQFAFDIAKQCGLRLPDYQMFDSWDAVEEFAGTVEEKVVFKPCGDASGLVPSFIAEDGEELRRMLNFYHHQVREGDKFAIQEYIEGEEISSAAWFNGQRFLRPFNHTLEEKRLMNGNIGPTGGCLGNAVWTCEGCPICEAIFVESGLEAFMNAHHLGAGELDINSIVTDDEIYFLEFTPRFGYDATPTEFMTLITGPLADFFCQVCDIDGVEPLPFRWGVGAGLRLSLSPWPFHGARSPDGVPIVMPDSVFEERFYQYDIVRTPAGEIQSSGGGTLGVVMGYGDSIRAAFDDAYKAIRKIKIPDVQYRTDLGEEFSRRFNRISRLSLAEV
jgi:phosphoribosylamine-glycine ligase